MREEILELLFPSRADFRAWLTENAETSEGVWLVFGKSKAVCTLSSNDALEEALCFGWIDGQMKRIDDTKYRKYFARRRKKSVWSEKNKRIIAALRAKNSMTDLGEKAVALAKENGMWNTEKNTNAANEQIETLTAKLKDFSPAYENYCKMSPSVRQTYARRYFSFKTETSREKDFVKIVERLNHNLKPM